MTSALQVTLFIVSLLTLIFITRKVRNAKVKLEDSIFWFCIAGLLLIVSIFPGIFFFLSDVAGTYSTVNFVFLFFIFVLLIQSFNLSMRVSQLDTKLKELTQQLAIEKFERHMNDRKRNISEEVINGSQDDETSR
ncbi:DUF2304 domain-containing protein [Eggerthella sp. YY7918]|uniref:DUF2304 domain-containing protein n=1 Tax=Eggerthella sp. (strain YY7918) TaxID=502558 RepID=UPI000217112E|nr:DUF2304 domain-containing protein [Eggerthella sp. YY7918]BAK44108.1 uncharacterized ACR [Eggerthella sp. YY7918]